MLKRYIIILIITVLVVIFALQNAGQVHIKLWFFDLDASLSLIIILMFAAGALITLGLALFEIGKAKRRISEPEKQETDSFETDAADSISSEKNSQT
jgi:uncharacterized integral membrane protein